ncbi:sensor histidine kinase [Paenibacillus beijingensis]|uniref:histidine kinase n=1 Tax=Paenibacillus beijingensis TaxID=1126833 RepID=A0A0D5NLP0_9BACL|nr:sensor histidine kinase [Paenibacillus beijingensis]AJY75922.1 histidine kinase [Paenibacillus beijingensis]
MRFWRFLKYEQSYLLLYAASFLIATAVFYMESHMWWHWDSIGYALILHLLLVAGFFFHRYRKNVHAIRHMNDEDSEQLSLEAEAYHQAMEKMEKAHIRALNEVQAKQNEYYNFIVSWFHEIKIPISVMRLMRQTEVDAKSLEEELSRVEHYVDQALYYAKLDSFNQDYELINCDLEPLIKEVVKSHSRSFISKKIRISLDVERAVVQSDSKWLQYIVHQLVTNSLKYTGNHGEVSIVTRVTPQEKLLVIRDNGIGIDRKDLPRIFNRGFTGTNGRTHMKSTGMGLYLAQELSRKLGHYITCTSEVGSFTEMVIHFPKNNDPYLNILQQSQTQ